MLPEDLGHGIGAAKQGVVIGLDALQQVEQNGIVLLEEGGTAGLEIKRLPCLPAEGKPQGEEITAEAMFSCPWEAARTRARSSSRTARSKCHCMNAASASITSSAPCPWPWVIL